VENVPALGGGTPSVSPRAAIGWWFVPVANLVKPYRIVADVYDRLAAIRPAAGRPAVPAWWLLWIAGSLTNNLARLLFLEVSTVADLRRQYALYAASDLFSVLAAVLAIVVVRRIQGWANARAAAGPNAPVPNVTGGVAGRGWSTG
jgi:hypothetical protein